MLKSINAIGQSQGMHHGTFELIYKNKKKDLWPSIWAYFMAEGLGVI